MRATCGANRRLAQTAGTTRFAFNGKVADPFATPERISVADAFTQYAGIDLLITIAPDGSTDREALAAQMQLKAIK